MEPQSNFFTRHYKIKEMNIDDDFSLEYIYKLFKENIQNNEVEKTLIGKNKVITFYGISSSIFNFKIDEKKVGDYILKEPIKLIKKENNQDFHIEIVSDEQISFIIQQTNLSTFFCTKESKIYNLNIYNLYDHKDKDHECILKPNFEFRKFNNQNELNINSQKYVKNFIKTTFKNIEEFEINSKHYFKLDKQINFNNTFVVFEEIDSDKRQFFVNSLLHKPINNNFYYYYGASGNGKTVTLI